MNNRNRVIWVGLMLALAIKRQRMLADALQGFDGGDEPPALPPLWYDATGDDL